MNASKYRKIARSQEAVFGGVCGGLAEYFRVDPFWLRLLAVASVAFLGTGSVMYLVLWWILPEANTAEALAPLSRDTHTPLARAVSHRRIFGVCGGLAVHTGLDPAWVRLGMLLLATASLGVVAAFYLLATFVLPEADERGTL